jgi:hypothetical protein
MSDLATLQGTLQHLSLVRMAEEAASAKHAALKTEARQLEVKARELMGTLGLSTLGHSGLIATIKRTPTYKPDDWLQIYNRIQRTGEFDLLHKRLNLTSMRERFNAGDVVPGVGVVDVETLVLTKDGSVL